MEEKKLTAHEFEAMSDEEKIAYYKKDYDQLIQESLSFAKEEAEKGDLENLVHLGIHYFNDENVDYDPVEAFHIFQRVEKIQPDFAYDFLVTMYLEGIGVEKNVEAALSMLKRLEKKKGIAGFCQATYCQIYLLEEGYQDQEKLSQHLLSFIEVNKDNDKNLDKESPINSDDYDTERDFRFAFDEREKLKSRFDNVRLVLKQIKKDPSKAYSLLDESYLKGSEVYKYLYAYIYLNGCGVTKDEEKAKEFLLEAFKEERKKNKDRVRYFDLPQYCYTEYDSSYCKPIYSDGHYLNEEETLSLMEVFKERKEYGIPTAFVYLIRAYLGRYPYVEKDYEKAYDLACEASHTCPDAVFEFFKAWIIGEGYLGENRENEAISILETAKKDNDDYCLYLTKLYLKLGNEEKAMENLLEYSKREMESDQEEVDNFFAHKEEIKEADEGYFHHLNDVMVKGMEYCQDGFRYLEEKKYQDAYDAFYEGEDFYMSQAKAMLAYMDYLGLGKEPNKEEGIKRIDALCNKYLG